MVWPANGETDWNTKMLAYLAIGHNTDGKHKKVYDIEEYGAVGDATTDNSVAIQAAIDAIKTVGSGCLYFPIGIYRVNTSLDCTGFLGNLGTTFRSLNIEGASINGSRILGATSGKPVFDFTASGYCSMENLRITGHSSDTPNVAILLARNDVAGSAGQHNLRRIFVQGEFTKGGIYNFASEVNVFDDIHITITGGGATWCMAFTESNFDSITSEYETILTTTAPSTRNEMIGGRLIMHDNPATGTCLYLYDSVSDLSLYGSYMYSAAQSHVKMYSSASTDTLYRINFHNLRCEGKAATTKPDYGIFMTGATNGAFSEILVENSYIDAYIYEIYQDNSVTGTFSGVIDRVRSVHGTEMKFNKVTHSVINVLTGDLTVDTSITQSDVTNYHTGTISLAGEDTVTERNLTTRLFNTTLVKRAEYIGILDNTGTPSVITGNIFKTGGTTAITALDDGVIGQVVLIIGAHSTTQLTDGGTLKLAGNCVLDTDDTIQLVFDGTNWHEISRTDIL